MIEQNLGEEQKTDEIKLLILHFGAMPLNGLRRHDLRTSPLKQTTSPTSVFLEEVLFCGSSCGRRIDNVD
ncbi:hypothetical protein CEXT_309051 [Caerostris extrusa]|uniref:Uncharacterized protein n=1 Tax=Caerostris extrusa TaxID=172846 RepID=A0AAV4XSY8_CAEEX|nr:hypothetical protein CEXT_309051 [Caerostris extrusa]